MKSVKYDISDLKIDYSKHAILVEKKPYYGLESFMQFKNARGKPVYVVDNHNYALYFWYLNAPINGTLFASRLIHIDQHTDRKENNSVFDERWLEKRDEKAVCDFIENKTNVGNFITPILPFIGEYIEVRTEYAFGQLSLLDYGSNVKGNIVLDIDLDFFSPEMGIDFKKKLPKLQTLIDMADCVTIATSPYFLDQNLAIDMLRHIDL